MSTGSAFTGLNPKQVFLVAGSSVDAGIIAAAYGWTPKFGNAMTFETSEGTPIRYIADAEKLRGITGHKLLLGQNWRKRSDRDAILSLIGSNEFLAEDIA